MSLTEVAHSPYCTLAPLLPLLHSIPLFEALLLLSSLVWLSSTPFSLYLISKLYYDRDYTEDSDVLSAHYYSSLFLSEHSLHFSEIASI